MSIYKSNRKDGRFVHTEAFLHEHYKSFKPKLAFDSKFTNKEFDLWKSKVKNKLIELMKFPNFNEEQPKPELIDKKEYKDYIMYKWEIYPEPLSVVPFLMLVPKKSGKKPAVLCISGSSGTKELLCNEEELNGEPTKNKHPYHNKMAWHYVKAGFIAVAVENPGVGELLRDHGDIWGGRNGFSSQMIMMGRNYLGLSVYQRLCILKWMKKHPEVDENRIALSGHSLGTESEMVLGILDNDVKAMIFNDFISNNKKRVEVVEPADSPIYGQGLWHLVPDFFEWLTFPDLLCAFAPKPLILTEGGVTRDIEIIKKSYQLTNSDNVKVHYYDKYKNSQDRKYDNVDIPEGVSLYGYLDYANVVAKEHYFKEYHAVPWLKKVFNY